MFTQLLHAVIYSCGNNQDKHFKRVECTSIFQDVKPFFLKSAVKKQQKKNAHLSHQLPPTNRPGFYQLMAVMENAAFVKAQLSCS